ncbi:hypothetical protein DV738_g2821, partial [Chaetothyriales sp. CBS 135597]
MATPEPQQLSRHETPPASTKAHLSPESARFYSPYDIVKRARSLTPMGHPSPSHRSEPIRRRLRQYETFDDAVKLLKTAQEVVVLAGAGISTCVGIPDFRSKDGLYNNSNTKKRFADPQELFTKSSFCDAPLAFYSDVRPIIPKLRAVAEGGGIAQPEDLVDYAPRFGLTHAFFKLLDDKKKLRTIYTQNIDGLEKAAGVDPGRVINCHGSWDTATCMSCEGKVSADDYLPVVYKGALPLCECAKVDNKAAAIQSKRPVRERPKKADVKVEYLQASKPKLRKSESTPSLKKRRRGSDDETSDPLSRPGLLKPDITFFDEGISRTYGPRLLRDASKVDLFLIIGTSLPVEPVNKLPFEIPASVPQIWISREHCKRPGLRVDIELLGDCDLVVEEICRRAGWSSALANRRWRNRFGSNLQSRRQLSELQRRRSEAALGTDQTGTGRKAEAQAPPKIERQSSEVKDKQAGTAPPKVKEEMSQTGQKPLPPAKVKIEADLGTDWKWYIRAPTMATAEKPLGFGYQLTAGAVAGVSEILLMYPLDVVKTRVQLQGKVPVPGQDYYTSMLDCFQKIIRNEGPARLYRGIGAPIMMEAPKRAVKFAGNDSWGIFYRRLFGVEKNNQPLAILTGASAGATESLVVVPFELVKIRLQDKAQAGKYSGILDVVTKTVKSEGILALYNGLESTAWRHILWNAGYFGCIFQVKALLPEVDPKNKTQALTTNLISGTIGGTVGTILNTPMDVVKSRIQNTPRVAGQVPKYNWAWPGLATIIKEEGVGALYKGFLPKVLRLGPGGGVLLVVYTNIMDWFRTWA